jgi:crossover junction endodeoxyribonuclease RusA
MSVRFRVDGLPIAQGSKRHVGRGILVESAKGLEPWRKAIKEAAGKAHPITLTGALEVRVQFFFPRPQSHRGTGRNAGRLKESAPTHHLHYPDLDKLLRALFDGLTSSGLILDDKYIVAVAADKMYGNPGMHVEVWELG